MVMVTGHRAERAVVCLWVVAAVAAVCHGCPVGEAGTTTCTPCPVGTYANTTTFEECAACPAGRYAPDTGTVDCGVCPRGADCRSPGTGDPVALPGWYRTVEGTFYACRSPATSRCVGGNQCGGTYAGPPSCDLCARDHYERQDYSEDASCRACPDFLIAYLVVFGLAVLGTCFMMVRLAKSATMFMTSLGVGLNFVQIVAVLATMDGDFPEGTQRSLNVLSLFNLNIDLLGFECISPTGLSSEDQFLVKLALPLVILVIFVLMYIGCKTMFCCRRACCGGAGDESSDVEMESDRRATATRHRKERIRDSGKAWEWAVINGGLAMLNLVYIAIVQSCLEIYDCEDPHQDGVERVRSQPHVVCDSVEWRELRSWSILGGAVYGLGIPALFAMLLRAKRRKLHHRSSVLQLGMLYRKYTKFAYLWEVVIIARKLVVVGIQVTASLLSSVSRLRVLLVLMTLFLVLQIAVWPYQSKRTNNLETFTLLCIDLILIAALFLRQTMPYQPGPTASSLIGTIVVGVVLFTILVIAVALYYDVRNARRMRKRGMVGAYATEDVQVHRHLFTSGFSMLSELRRVTTTDHASLVFAYEHEAYARTARPRLSVRAIERTRFDRLRRARRRPRAFDGSVLVQHDRDCNLFKVSAIFPRPGSYVLYLSGGLELPPYEKICCFRRTLGRKDLESRQELWYPKRMLMTYNLVVTERAAVGPRQKFVDVQQVLDNNGVLHAPLEYLLTARTVVFFRVKLPGAREVVVEQREGASRTRLVRERPTAGNCHHFHPDTFSGDVTIAPSGRVFLLAVVQNNDIEQAMGTSTPAQQATHDTMHDPNEIVLDIPDSSGTGSISSSDAISHIERMQARAEQHVSLGGAQELTLVSYKIVSAADGIHSPSAINRQEAFYATSRPAPDLEPRQLDYADYADPPAEATPPPPPSVDESEPPPPSLLSSDTSSEPLATQAADLWEEDGYMGGDDHDMMAMMMTRPPAYEPSTPSSSSDDDDDSTSSGDSSLPPPSP